MEADITRSVDDVLSSREKASLLMAQDLYAVRAKEAALELVGAIGLEDAPAEQFLGGIATRLEEMDWEQRRQAAEALRNAAQALGATALDRVDGSTELTLVPDISGAGQEAGQNGNPRLNDQQRRWLSSVVDEPVVDDIEALPLAGRLVFANNLGRAYQTFSVRRQSEADKADRAHQLNELMSGKSIAEIAESAETREINISNRFKSMATIIRRNLTPEEIIGMIPGQYAEQAELMDSLNHIQRNWCGKVFEKVEDAEATITDLTPKQRDHLAELLVRRLSAYIVRRNGPEKTRRRTQQVVMLLHGDNMAKIVEACGLPEGNVKNELHRSAVLLAEKVSPDDLEIILRQAAEYDD